MSAPARVSFQSLLGDDAEAPLVGLEHEYRLCRNGEAIDFRHLIHGLAVPGRRLDPGDTNAYRCASGLAVTCDEAEAEIASPPLALAPHFTSTLDGWASAGLGLLGDILPAGVGVGGFSTHLSAAMPEHSADAVMDLLVRRFAPALMMVVDRPDSHGLYFRPRPGRMELCGEYVMGRRLRAAAALFVGAAQASAAAVAGGPSGALPSPLAVAARPAEGRYGLRVDRRLAFGFDLYAEGRRSVLPLAAGGTITAQDHLAGAWACAGAALRPFAAPGDLEPMDRIVSGAWPLGIEGTDDDAGGLRSPPAATPFGGLLADRERPGVEVAAVLATWSFTVFALRAGRHRPRFACVPRAQLSRFLFLLDAGDLDDVLAAHARSPFAGHVLAAFSQTRRAGLWDAVGDPAGLLPPERDTPGAASPARFGKPSSSARRPAKPVLLPQPAAPLPEEIEPPVVLSPFTGAPPVPPAPRPTTVVVAPAAAALRPGSRWVGALIAAVLLAVVVGVAFATGLIGGGGGSDVIETGTTLAPTTTPTTAAPTSSTTEAPTTTAAGTPTSTTPPTTSAGATTVPGATTPPPAPTVPVVTTVPPVVTTTIPPVVTTTVPPATTTTAAPIPTTVTVGDNCTFSPGSVSVPVGSPVRFRNQSAADVTLTVTGPPGSSDVLISLESGGVSAPYVLTVGGTYTFRCRGAGTGTIAVTAA